MPDRLWERSHLDHALRCDVGRRVVVLRNPGEEGGALAVGSVEEVHGLVGLVEEDVGLREAPKQGKSAPS